MSQQESILIGSFGVDLTDGHVYGGTVPRLGEDRVYTSQPVPLEFLTVVAAEIEHLRGANHRLQVQLESAEQPRPIEQALATLARAWQAALVPAQEMLEPTDLMLEYQRAGYDANLADVVVHANPWPVGSPSSESWRVGWFMANNEEGRP